MLSWILGLLLIASLIAGMMLFIYMLVEIEADGPSMRIIVLLIAGIILLLTPFVYAKFYDANVSGSKDTLEDEREEIIEALEINPFSEDNLLKAVEINYYIDTDNIRGDGDYFGMDPIDYKAIQKEYVLDNFGDEMTSEAVSTPGIETELIGKLVEKIIKQIE